MNAWTLLWADTAGWSWSRLRVAEGLGVQWSELVCHEGLSESVRLLEGKVLWLEQIRLEGRSSLFELAGEAD